MKYIARQINPEYQESPLYMFKDIEELENIFIFGNRDFCGVNVDEYDEFVNQINGVLSAIDDGFGDEYWQYENFEECLRFELYDDNVPETTVEEWEKLLIDNFNTFTTDSCSDICKALNIYTGEQWNYTTIKGYCQSDWNNVVYNVNDWSEEDIKKLEIEYFNLGSEWLIDYEPIADETINSDDFNVDDYGSCAVYVYDWTEDGQRKELADAIGCKPEDVIMFEYAGSYSTPIYNKI